MNKRLPVVLVIILVVVLASSCVSVAEGIVQVFPGLGEDSDESSPSSPASDSKADQKTSGSAEPEQGTPITIDSSSDPSRSESTRWSVTGWPIKELSTAEQASYLDALEKEIVLHLNMARTDPTRYATEFIAPRRQYFRGDTYREPGGPSSFAGVRTREGVAAVDECVSVMRATDPRERLLPAEGMSKGAADHAADQAQTGGLGHTGSDGSEPAERVKRYGEWKVTIGENIAYGPDIAREIVVGLLIDDGVPGRGHRENILNPNFQVVGVAVDTHPQYGHVTVMDFAGGYDDESET